MEHKKKVGRKSLHSQINNTINQHLFHQTKRINKILLGMKDCIIEKSYSIGDGIKDIQKSVVRESNETWIASKILLKIIKRQKVSEEEVVFLKSQTVDVGKAISLIGLQAIPGSSFAIILIEKALKKYGLTLFPKEQKLPLQE